MVWWKQYIVLLVGTGMVLIGTSTSITFFAIQEPLDTNLVLISFFGAVVRDLTAPT